MNARFKLLLLLAGVSAVQAAEQPSGEPRIEEDAPAGFYLGAGAGWSNGDGMESSSGAGRLIFGYQPSPYLGIEAGYEYLAGYDQEYCVAEQCWQEHNTITGPTIAVSGRLPLADELAVLGRLGVFSWHNEADGFEDESGSDPFFSVGGAYRFRSYAEASLLYSRFMLNGSDSPATESAISAVTLNLTFHF